MAKAEVSIVVKAYDAATRVLKSVGHTVGKLASTAGRMVKWGVVGGITAATAAVTGLAYWTIKATNAQDAADAKLRGVLRGYGLLGAELDAVTARREVRFDYHKLTGSKPEHRLVQPYHVGQIEHGWYLVAYDPSRKDMRTFALQRLTNLEVLKSKFERDQRFSARTHLGGGFGVWSYDEKENHAHDIRIRFTSFSQR
jgi:hypothetical protein